jgi:hypothetical protein
MGTIFEELIRRFNEENNEEAGEHGKDVSIHLFGQEINPETYAICKADLLLKGEGQAAENIKFGSTLSTDAFPAMEFDFMLSNPRYGKSWKTELERMGGKKDLNDTRFNVQHKGEELSLITRSSDGQLMFLVNKLAKMNHHTPLGSRIAEVHNGSSLFTGDAGQGESNIRRWIIESDWLEAIIALPLNMFYNTGIATYIWVLTNRKFEPRRGKVQLIDATGIFQPLRENLGKKNCELSDDQIKQIIDMFLAFEETEQSKIFPNAAFGYWKITVERPLRLVTDLSAPRLERFERACEVAKEEPLAYLVQRVAKVLGAGPHLDFDRVLAVCETEADQHGVNLTAKRLKLFLAELTSTDPAAAPVIRKVSKPGKVAVDPLYGRYEREIEGKLRVAEYEPDSNLRDTEQVPRLKQWDQAGQIFRAGAESVQPGSFELTKFGLGVDAALAVSLGGNQAAAAELLADAVVLLPAEAAKEDDERWEAVQRAAVSVCRTIENSLWKPKEAEPQFEPGYASSPDLKVSKVVPGQAVRSELTRVHILHLISTLATDPTGFVRELEMLTSSRYFTVRFYAIEAQLALAYSTGAGDGFVEALIAYDRTIAESSAYMQQGLSPLDPDDGPKSGLPVSPDRWFGLLCAGVVCTGPSLLTNLKIWHDASNQLLGEDSALKNNIQLFLNGASLPLNLLHPTLSDSASLPALRCGAAAQLLQGILSAEKTLQIQAFLTSGLVCDDSLACQELFNRHVARCFADSWRTHAQSPFQFCSPRASVPALIQALDEIERGSGTLKSLLVAAASALRQPLGAIMKRVL